MMITEVVGWIGNVVVILSFLQKKIKNLRVYALIGSMVWIVYSIRVESNSLIVLNIVIMVIQIYHLYKIRIDEKKKKYPWMYPIYDTDWKQEDPPIVSSLDLDDRIHTLDTFYDEEDIIEDPFVS